LQRTSPNQFRNPGVLQSLEISKNKKGMHRGGDEVMYAFLNSVKGGLDQEESRIGITVSSQVKRWCEKEGENKKKSDESQFRIIVNTSREEDLPVANRRRVTLKRAKNFRSLILQNEILGAKKGIKASSFAKCTHGEQGDSMKL